MIKTIELIDLIGRISRDLEKTKAMHGILMNDVFGLDPKGDEWKLNLMYDFRGYAECFEIAIDYINLATEHIETLKRSINDNLISERGN